MSTAGVDSEAVGATPTEPENLSLAADFPPASRDEWGAAVDAVVRKTGRISADAEPGAGVESLVRHTHDGIAVRPLHTAVDVPTGAVTGVPGRAPFVRGARAAGVVPDGWDVRARHADPDPQATRLAIDADLDGGVNSIWLAVGAGATAVADLPAVLAGVMLDLAPVVLDADADASEAAEAFLALAAERDIAAADLLGTLGLDPVGQRVRTGSGPEIESVVPLARRVADGYPQVRAIVVDAVAVPEAGGSDAQELGFSLASGLAYLRALTTAAGRADDTAAGRADDTAAGRADDTAGLDLPTAARLLEFRYAATADQFGTIAKLRAARRLWARVTEVCGAAQPQAQHAVASPVMLTRRDPYVNLLRGTVAGFAAGVGGADAVTVAPFDAAIGPSGPFSRRIARNTQTLLVEESHLARVIDAAGGSWYVESLTDQLARAGWAFFQEIETAGGVLAALDGGLVAQRTAEMREQRARDVATRRTPIVGVSEFPNLDEAPAQRRAAAAGDGYRAAEPFEAFRDRSDVVLAGTGARPRVFLATLGPLAAYSARAGFARNLLHAGGIETPEAGPTETAEAVASAFAQARTPVAVLCSTDALYDERAEATVAALREAGASHVLLAGKAESPAVDGRLHAGCDALAVIEAVYGALEGEQ